MGRGRIGLFLRAIAKWLVPLAVIVFIVVRVKFARVPVLAHEVKAGPIVAEVMGTGTLEARVKTVISPRIQGILSEVLVDQNDPVEAGQLLALLEDQELKLQVDVAESALAAARASAQRVRADEARAQAVVHQAQLEHQRIAGLLTNRISSQADFDKAIELLNVASADLRRSQAAIVEADSQVQTAEKQLAHQRELLTYTRIVSPYNGLIVRRDRDPGGVIVPGGSLMQVISTNEIWVSAWVDETAMAGLAPGQPARVVFRSEPARSYPGEVARLGLEADRETREFVVDVRVNRLPQVWAVGQRAEVFIETGRKSGVLTVPPQFVQWRNNRPGVFVNERDVAVWRDVTTGLRGQADIEIAQGLSEGEQVVAPRDFQTQLRPGQRIRAGGSIQLKAAP
ncbi:MAG: efflux RND transporter periplasmic adaptor subunit [Verrucomicrobia bacterium]|jgi:HlyD family secretion protein|nr:efflux RND transporter periplasmic adaptor subunit [Verrucomicrobiota bacterium]OQC65515.1 MAG: Macrolide export protein MacA [Verrucomicrobia bacterium ADurb.Bin006]MDI9381688.1 efflux RND transporter periplasmic adaptor subunit [Verrucomicrobiota bacterium]NMD18888.1 efflux RND transporter periplasmic adaptor subunit [Verrucomicrobiota bacterium]HNU99071.1 efflux RND transporter periplasmic adaptor subunit [Verrucomicrobiota bacterium]